MNQAVFETGTMGGNVMLVLKYQFTVGTESSTLGLGSTGVTGVLGGARHASTFGSVIGYAKGKARPVTLSFMQVMCFHSKMLETVSAFENK